MPPKCCAKWYGIKASEAMVTIASAKDLLVDDGPYIWITVHFTIIISAVQEIYPALGFRTRNYRILRLLKALPNCANPAETYLIESTEVVALKRYFVAHNSLLRESLTPPESQP